MTLSDQDTMINLNFKHLFTKIEKGIKSINTNQPEDILLVVDNINILFNSCYTRNELDLIETFNEFLNYCELDNVSLALCVNRDLIYDENSDSYMGMSFYRDLKNSKFN